MGDGDNRIDSYGRAERARMLAGDGAGAGEEQVAPKGPSRKEVTQAAFDKGIENLTYGLTAPIPLQIWHSAKGAVDAIGPKQPEAPAAAVTGVRLYPLIEKDLPKTTRSGEAVHAGPFSLHPQMARGADGKESVAYYTAVRHGRAEFAVGTDSVEMFKAHTNIYEQQADYDWGITTARPYEKDVYRTGEAISNQDYKGAVLHGWHSWEHAFGDPTWAAQRVADVAVAAAPGARGVNELGDVHPTASSEAVNGVRGANPASPAAAVKNVNPTGGKLNCGSCAVASDATLAGSPASALPGGRTGAADLAKAYGRPWSAPLEIAGVEASMQQAAPGARGIVFASRPPVDGAPVDGHFFNAVNQGGAVHLVDGQSGGAVDLGPRQGYDRFFLLRTN